MADYMNLQEVLAELQIDESRLRELVASGQLRSFRDQGVEKFRRSDVMKLKTGAETQPTVVLPGEEPSEEQTTRAEPPPIPLEGEEPGQQAGDAEEQTVVPTIELSFDEDQESSSETMIPTIELSPEDRAEGEDTSVPTEPIGEIGDEATDVATEEVALADDDYVVLDDEPAQPAAAGVDFSDTDTDTSEDLGTDTAAAADERGLEFEEEAESHVLFTVLLALTGVALLAAVSIFIAAVRPPMQPKWLYDAFLDLGAKLGIQGPM